MGYTRYYTYDRGGNLMQIQHQGSANYSNPIVVSDRSNHAVAQTAANTLKPSDIDTGPYFDACGNSLQQTPGRPLTWNARNQLLTAVTVDRGADPAQNDRESYGYDGSGMRLWKVSQSQTSGTVRQQKVIYLHGLELRTTTSDQTPVETLEVIAAGQIGHASLSVLSWTLGKPSDIPNNQYRYSLGDQVGSVNLELNDQAAIITAEEFYPYGGTAVWGGSASQVKYKFIRYSGKERDATGLYYYGYRYLMPWLGRWLNADPGGTVDGLNLYRMVKNNPLIFSDPDGRVPEDPKRNLVFPKGDTVRVFRVEIKNKDEKFGHIEVEDGEIKKLYFPPPAETGTLPNEDSYRTKYEFFFKKDGSLANTVLGMRSFNKKTGQTTPFTRKTPKKPSVKNSENSSESSKTRRDLIGLSNKPLGVRGWFNFGDPQRAYDFFRQKLNNPQEKYRSDFIIKSFEVPSHIFTEIAKLAILESETDKDDNLPQNVDLKSPNQLSLPTNMVEYLEKNIISGTTVIYSPSDHGKIAHDTNAKVINMNVLKNDLAAGLAHLHGGRLSVEQIPREPIRNNERSTRR